MGIFDRASPVVEKIGVGSIILVFFGVFVAMCVTVPVPPILSDPKDLEALNTGDQAWMLASTALVLLMTPGVAFFYGGMIQHKNVVATMMQVFVALAIIPMLWAIVGFSFAFGPTAAAGLFGHPGAYGLMYNVGAAPNPDLAPTIPLTLFFLFQMVFAVITPTLIIGAVADRVNVSALCIFVGIWHILVYCPLAHMVWHPSGIIRKFGVIDFAGGTVVHMSSGYSALAAAKYLGHGLKPPAGFEHLMEPANVPYVVLGTTFLWFGWFGFNAGSALGSGPLTALAFFNTNASAASAMITWMLMDIIRGKKMRATGACVGAVIGLVSVTPASGFVNSGAAFLIGIIGAVCCSGMQELMERYGRKYVDDTLDVFACHGFGGTVGMVCTALFSTVTVNPAAVDGAFYGKPLELAKCLLVIVIIVPWFLIFTWGCLWFTDLFLSLRVSDEEMLKGLDVSKHGERAFYTGEPSHADVVIDGKGPAKPAATVAAPPV